MSFLNDRNLCNRIYCWYKRHGGHFWHNGCSLRDCRNYDWNDDRSSDYGDRSSSRDGDSGDRLADWCHEGHDL